MDQGLPRWTEPQLEIRLQSVTAVDQSGCDQAPGGAGLVSMWSRFNAGAVHLRQAFLECHTV